jgi:hypothetical protein
VGRQILGEGRNERSLQRSGGNDNPNRCVRPVLGPHQEAGAIRVGRDRSHPNSLAHWSAERAGIDRQVSSHLVLAHEAVRIVACVGETWQLERPVRTNQT